MERRYRITVEGRPYEVTVEDLSDSGLNRLYPQPGSMALPSVPPPATARAGAPAPAAPTGDGDGGAGAGAVCATIGGMVESVPVVVGQAVQQGDTVVVLEAMKMNSPVIAHRAGEVTHIAVKPGDAVEVGHVLLTIA
jgi:glutaconyl-CoA/methylmalonyl-CoA decarboxylase subunit gamma